MVVSQPEFLSLTNEWYGTFLRKPEDDITRVVSFEVANCAELLSSSWANEELADKNGRQLLFELFYLYTHLLSRTAFDLFGHEFRCELQNRLANTCLPMFVYVVMPPDISTEKQREVSERFYSGLNETELLYGGKSKATDWDTKGVFSDEAVLPTFARRVSALLGRPHNPATIIEVQILLAGSIRNASLDSLVTCAKENT